MLTSLVMSIGIIPYNVYSKEIKEHLYGPEWFYIDTDGKEASMYVPQYSQTANNLDKLRAKAHKDIDETFDAYIEDIRKIKC